MKNKNVLYLTQAAMIAALYVVLTMIANALGIASGNIQVRFSEALTVLPFLTPAAVPGLFIGCLIANLVTGAMLPDIIFGSLATLIGAIGTWMLGKEALGKNTKKVSSSCFLEVTIPFFFTCNRMHALRAFYCHEYAINRFPFSSNMLRASFMPFL